MVKIADGEEEDSSAALSNAPVPDDWKHVPRDGVTIGEIMMRGNGEFARVWRLTRESMLGVAVVMKGYLDDPEATEEVHCRHLLSNVCAMCEQCVSNV